MSIFSHFQERFEATRQEEYSSRNISTSASKTRQPMPPPPSAC